MTRFAFALVALALTLLACTQSAPTQNGVPYGGTWLLTFTPQGAAQTFLFRVEITGQTEAGSYGSSVMCSTSTTCDAASERFAQIPKEAGKLRVLIYDGKVITFAGEDADGMSSNAELRGTAAYLTGERELSGPFVMTQE